MEPLASKKRRKVDIHRFLDIEAAEVDEEEDEDEDEDMFDDFIRDDGKLNGSDGEDGADGDVNMTTIEDDGNTLSSHRGRFLENKAADAMLEHQESENLAALYRERVRQQSAPQLLESDHGFVERSQELFGAMPSLAIQVDDAPLWRVPVKTGSEDAAAWYILEHVEAFKNQYPPLTVKSAFARSIAPGYVYVEASSARDVRLACEGFVGYRGRTQDIVLTSVDDAIALLKHSPLHPELCESSWVRIKRGDYKEDLAYLDRLVLLSPGEEAHRTRGTACVRLIPRISNEPRSPTGKTRGKAKYVSGEARPSGAERSLKRNYGIGSVLRPSQQLFNPLVWSEEAVERPHQPGTWVFRDALYKDGLLDMHVPINPLNLTPATPSRNELLLWTECEDKTISGFAMYSQKHLVEEFWENDRVEVIKGDRHGTVGIVQSVNEKTLLILIWGDVLNGDAPHSSSSLEIEIQTSSVRKVFRVADYVEAIPEGENPRRGFVVGISQENELRDIVTILEHGCENEFSVSSTVLHLRDPPQPYQPLPLSLSQGRRNLIRLARLDTRPTLSMPLDHLQNLLKGMPVVIADKLAKGYRGDIRSVHEKYKNGCKTYNVGEDIQHQCVSACRHCAGWTFIPHDCDLYCQRCNLDKQPTFKEGGSGTEALEEVTVDVYVPAQSRIHTINIVDIRPTDDILSKLAYLAACKTIGPRSSLNSNMVRWTSATAKARWQAATLKLIKIQFIFGSKSFDILCRTITVACEQRQCENGPNLDNTNPLTPCKHDIASHDERIRMRNKFGLTPFWYIAEFEALHRTIVSDCEARRCELETDEGEPLPRCKHDANSRDARVEALWRHRFGLVPLWHRADSHTGESLSYMPIESENEVQLHPHTPQWAPDHEYPSDPAWNPNSSADPWKPESDGYTVDADWLDESLRGLQTVLHLNMASGSRSHSRTTAGLLWDNNPKLLNDLPIRCVIPNHPTPEDIGLPVLFIRGPSKGKFGVVQAINGERATVAGHTKKKDRRKRPEVTEHSIHDLTTSQWPK